VGSEPVLAALRQLEAAGAALTGAIQALRAAVEQEPRELPALRPTSVPTLGEHSLVLADEVARFASERDAAQARLEAIRLRHHALSRDLDADREHMLELARSAARTHARYDGQWFPDSQMPEDLDSVMDQAARAQDSFEQAQLEYERCTVELTHAEMELQLNEVRLEGLVSQLRDRAASQVEDVPVRELVLISLEEIELPCPSNLLSRYISARFGREVKSTRWGPLRADERAAFDRSDETARQAKVWLVHPFEPDGTAQTRMWMRSDWETDGVLYREDLQLLQARACRLAELATSPPDGTADPYRLREVAIDEGQKAFDGHEIEMDPEGALRWMAQNSDYYLWAPSPARISDHDIPF
jgi:hypothetical protein